jgi:hypothetical protein
MKWQLSVVLSGEAPGGGQVVQEAVIRESGR